MRFTENEMTVALTGLAKDVVTMRAAAAGTPITDIESAWAEMDRHTRYLMLTGLGDQILAVLPALPDIEVEPGTRPTFTLDEAARTVAEVFDAEVTTKSLTPTTEQRDQAIAGRLALVSVALGHLPVRRDPDALLNDDGSINPDEFVVPDTLEGL